MRVKLLSRDVTVTLLSRFCCLLYSEIISDIGTALFYHVTGAMDDNVMNYQPTVQFFTSCIEILGKVSSNLTLCCCCCCEILITVIFRTSVTVYDKFDYDSFTHWPGCMRCVSRAFSGIDTLFDFKMCGIFLHEYTFLGCLIHYSLPGPPKFPSLSISLRDCSLLPCTVICTNAELSVRAISLSSC